MVEQNILWFSDEYNVENDPWGASVAELLDMAVDRGFTAIAYQVGHSVAADGTISISKRYDVGGLPIDPSTILALAHARDLEVYAGVFQYYFQAGDTFPQLDSSTVQAKLVSEISNIFTTYGFDGVVSDLETDWYGIANLPAGYWTGMVAYLDALKAAWPTKTVCQYWIMQNGTHTTITDTLDAANVDFFMLDFPATDYDSEDSFTAAASLNSSWVLHLFTSTSPNRNWRDFIDFYGSHNVPDSQLGFSVWTYYYFTADEDWGVWYNWPVKDLEEEEPEEPEPPVEPPPIEYYTVNVSSAGGGSVEPSGSNQVQVGTTFWVHASADEDYLFNYWARNGVEITPHNPNYAITDGEANWTYTMTAYFTANPPTPPDTPSNPGATFYSVNVEGSTGLTLSLTGVQTLTAGSEGETLTVSVDEIAENWRFTYWLYDNTTKYYSRTVTVGPEASDTAHTLLAVSQAVEPPPPNQFIPPASASVGIVSASPLFRQITRKVKKQKPVDLRKLFKSLKKAKL